MKADLQKLLEKVNQARIERFGLEGRSRSDGLTPAERLAIARRDLARARAQDRAAANNAAVSVARAERAYVNRERWKRDHGAELERRRLEKRAARGRR